MKILRISCMLVGFLFLVLSLSARTQTFNSLFSFDNGDGADPYAGLIQGTDGNFYGTTEDGGANCGEGGCGTVFKITPSGKLTTLYSFCSQSNCTDGAYPYAGLIQATDGNFYGTAQSGGANGGGTIFKITPSGKLTTLHSFDGTDGAYPYARLIQATNGNFYGTTQSGGADGDGTVFKITLGGKLTTLHSFDGTDGAYPYAGLIQATDGNFYGTTESGGANGDGTVFKITLGGKLTTLYSFCSQSNCTDGGYPYAGLVQATDGNFYGTTVNGGADGDGRLFKITPGGKLSGGGSTYGTVFKITPGGELTTLHSFDGTDGASPFAGLIQAANGSFYGTTEYGGSDDDCVGNGGPIPCGNVFSLSLGLGPFVETNPTSGKVGTAVKILGTDLTGATSVTFNGTVAKFKVVSASLIKTTVPEGATTGEVEVKTPKGTLKSNVVFRVTK